jgi:hypothetical protein
MLRHSVARLRRSAFYSGGCGRNRSRCHPWDDTRRAYTGLTCYRLLWIARNNFFLVANHPTLIVTHRFPPSMPPAIYKAVAKSYEPLYISITSARRFV